MELKSLVEETDLKQINSQISLTWQIVVKAGKEWNKATWEDDKGVGI